MRGAVTLLLSLGLVGYALAYPAERANVSCDPGGCQVLT